MASERPWKREHIFFFFGVHNKPFYSYVLSCQVLVWNEAEGDLVVIETSAKLA